MADLLVPTNAGLYCPIGDFHVDPWGPVARAVITHAHADHARAGSASYLCATGGADVLRARLGPTGTIESIPYGETCSLGGVALSLHPAGHILGSAQVRLEYRGEVWVFSGDYKLAHDATTAAFEPLRCHTFVSECTFGLPIYRWPTELDVLDAINAWWSRNAEAKQISVVYAYALGKAQRVLHGLDTSTGPVLCHGAVQRMNALYRQGGVELPETEYAGRVERAEDWQRALILAPPSARATPWLKRFGDFEAALVSGWMQIRGVRRRRAVERGFVLSDHADWPGLLRAIDATGAQRILLTHGVTGPMVQWLRERGLQAEALITQFEGEQDELPEQDMAGAADLDAESQPAEESQP